MINKSRGFFISFEGVDGAGKSTQIGKLADYLRARGIIVQVTREPGGTINAEAIRRLIVEGDAERWSPLSEALLMYAARADHLDRVIRPALSRGEIVITDRFADSTAAYQGIAGGLGEDAVRSLHRAVVGSDDPDLTLI
ncbi:MAG: dTMP kinase, partial [Parvularculaceae bacterium]|nr:dTMP kinase [Parvularculaceae bacterium]